jgi:hypothetical protein
VTLPLSCHGGSGFQTASARRVQFERFVGTPATVTRRNDLVPVKHALQAAVTLVIFCDQGP